MTDPIARVEAGPRELSYSERYELTILGAKAAGQAAPVMGANCVALTGHGLIDGTAKAVWRSSGLPQTLDLVAMVPNGTVVARSTGPGDLEISLAGLWLDGRGAPNAFVFVMVSEGGPNGAGAAVSQPVELALQFSFVSADGGRVDLEDGWACGDGP